MAAEGELSGAGRRPVAVAATTAFAWSTLAALTLGTGAAPAAAAKPSPDPGAIAGRTVIDKGALVYTDYLYDAWGPNLDGAGNAPDFPSAPTAYTSGDYRYPDGSQYAGDAADLRELRLTLTDKGLEGRVSLETMADPSVAIATVAIDADADASTGAGNWPDGARLTTPGADLMVTAWGGGARLTTASGQVRSIPGAAKAGKRRFDFTIPAKLLGKLAKSPRAWAGVGLASADGSGHYAEPPAPGTATSTAVWDLAFQGNETYEDLSSWGDQRQAAALASGDVAPFAGKLKTKAMREGRSSAPKLRPGYYNAILRSADDYGEGISTREESQFGGASPEFLGHYQPYGLYIPHAFKPGKKLPLLLALHSLSRNHNQYESTTPNFLTQLGDERNSIVVTPLARGTDTWYLDSGFSDTLEAWDDVGSGIAGIVVDPDRTSLIGYSMGGYGTYKLGLLMPDRFARAVTYVGPPAFAAWFPPGLYVPDPAYRYSSLTNPLVPNALNLPYEINAGGQDALVFPSGTKAQAASFASAGDQYRFYFHPDATHYTFAIDDTWTHTQQWLAGHRRIVNPRRVRYVRIPAFDLPDHDLRFDSAYWASGIELRDATAPDASGSIDATALPLAEPSGAIVDEGTTEIPAGQSGSTAATVTGQHLVAGGKPKLSNGFEATLANIGAATLDAKRMGLDLGRTVKGKLSGDGETTLRLRVPKSAPTLGAKLDGHSVATRRDGKDLVLDLKLDPGTEHRLEIVPRKRK
ncbi:MAG: alpha/beta hydrolase-fold protein [Solirubrobacterales bacterium]